MSGVRQNHGGTDGFAHCDGQWLSGLHDGPDRILATQHYNSVMKFLGGMSVNVKLLTGSSEAFRNGRWSIRIDGWYIEPANRDHALLEDVVTFKNLGMVVIDEQHRFGVMQRAKLWRKNFIPPHILVMTATPIPRTLAMTVYGDLDVSVIDELPPGEKTDSNFTLFWKQTSAGLRTDEERDRGRTSGLYRLSGLFRNRRNWIIKFGRGLWAYCSGISANLNITLDCSRQNESYREKTREICGFKTGRNSNSGSYHSNRSWGWCAQCIGDDNREQQKVWIVSIASVAWQGRARGRAIVYSA